MSAAAEARISAILTADPICGGRVAASTIRTLATEMTREAKPDSDVLAERGACLSLMEALRARLGQLSHDEQDGVDVVFLDAFALELRRLDEAIASVRLGLHRLNGKEQG